MTLLMSRVWKDATIWTHQELHLDWEI